MASMPGPAAVRAVSENATPSTKSRTRPLPPDDREIGYRKPPSQHQWRKGRSGNPAGRKKGSRNKRTIIVRLMEQKLGRKIENLSKLTRYEAMLLKGIQKALTGDTKAYLGSLSLTALF